MENKTICSLCKGRCCKTMGCHYSPDDFTDLTYEGLKREIDKGHISIDWWEGNPFNDDRYMQRAYFLRVRNKVANVVDPSWGGECSLLTEDGCPLSYKERPKGGRELEPSTTGVCIARYDKIDAAKDWYKYNDILDRLADEYSVQDERVDMLMDRAFKYILEALKDC